MNTELNLQEDWRL